MMSLLQKKLNSKRGASMILVLSLFLICVMVSSVILAAASSGVSRNAQRVKQQRGYLAISSASDLIVEELEIIGKYYGKNLSRKYSCKDCTVPGYIYYEGNQISGYRLESEYINMGPNVDPYDDGHLIADSNKEHEPEASVTVDNQYLKGAFAGVFERACTKVFSVGYAYEETIKIAMDETDERMPEVICDFKMDEDYNVEFVLRTEESKYAISISCAATVKSERTPDSDQSGDEHVVYFKKFDSQTGTYKTDFGIWSIPVERETITTEISWGGPNIVKEVLSQ